MFINQFYNMIVHTDNRKWEMSILNKICHKQIESWVLPAYKENHKQSKKLREPKGSCIMSSNPKLLSKANCWKGSLTHFLLSHLPFVSAKSFGIQPTLLDLFLFFCFGCCFFFFFFVRSKGSCIKRKHMHNLYKVKTQKNNCTLRRT